MHLRGNIIKISVYNHLLAHYCLWKIYDDWDSRHAIQRMCGQKKYIGDLTEDELKEIAKLQEECAKENRTEEELKEYMKEYRKSDKCKKAQNKYDNQLCFYNGETLTLCALKSRFIKSGIEHPTIEAKKYIKNNNPIEFYDVYP